MKKNQEELYNQIKTFFEERQIKCTYKMKNGNFVIENDSIKTLIVVSKKGSVIVAFHFDVDAFAAILFYEDFRKFMKRKIYVSECFYEEAEKIFIGDDALVRWREQNELNFIKELNKEKIFDKMMNSNLGIEC